MNLETVQQEERHLWSTAASAADKLATETDALTIKRGAILR